MFFYKKNLNMKNYKLLFNKYFIFTGLLIILFFRLDSSLFYPGMLNPDEFQIAASGMRLNNGYSWNNIDNITSGPISSIVVSWPYLIGLEITLFTIRLTALTLILLKFYLIYKIVIKLTNLKNTILLIAPFIIFYLLSSDKNFLHYNTELVPIVLSLILIQLYLKKKLNNFFLFLIGFILVLIFFSKIQFALLSTFFFILFSKLYLDLKNFFLLILGSFTAVIIFFIPLIINNEIKDFFYSYIFINFSWTEPSGWLKFSSEITKSLLDNKETKLSEKFFYNLFYNPIIYLILIYVVIVLIIFLKYKIIFKVIKNQIFFWLFIITLISALLPGKLYLHYISIFIPFLLIFTASILKDINLSKNYIFFFFAIIFLISIFIEKINFYKKYQINVSVKKINFFKKNDLYNGLFDTEFNSLFVWGWKPEWHIFSGLKPASRESVPINQIRKTNLNNYYNQRMFNDFQKSSPDIVTDAVKIKSFYITDNLLQIKKFGNALSKYILQNYSLVKNGNSECADIYLKKIKYKNFIDKNVEIKFIKLFSNNNDEIMDDFQNINLLHDLSVNEELCNNYWLNSNSNIAILKIFLKRTEKITKLNILNTSNALQYDYGVNEIEIKTFNGVKLVEQKNLYLNLYPKWTLLNLQEPFPIDRIELKIISFYGKGFGLNEIKLFR